MLRRFNKLWKRLEYVGIDWIFWYSKTEDNFLKKWVRKIQSDFSNWIWERIIKIIIKKLKNCRLKIRKTIKVEKI